VTCCTSSRQACSIVHTAKALGRSRATKVATVIDTTPSEQLGPRSGASSSPATGMIRVGVSTLRRATARTSSSALTAPIAPRSRRSHQLREFATRSSSRRAIRNCDERRKGELMRLLRLDHGVSIVPCRGLSRAEAAWYIGVSPSLFDEMVKDGRRSRVGLGDHGRMRRKGHRGLVNALVARADEKRAKVLQMIAQKRCDPHIDQRHADNGCLARYTIEIGGGSRFI
jgi:hypothetical protein